MFTKESRIPRGIAHDAHRATDHKSSETKQSVYKTQDLEAAIFPGCEADHRRTLLHCGLTTCDAFVYVAAMSLAEHVADYLMSWALRLNMKLC